MKRLSPAFLTVLMLGVVGLLVALYVAKTILGREEPVAQEEIVNIPMALTDLEPGTRLTDAHIGMGRARGSKITPDIVRTNRVIVGRVVKNRIPAAQPISTFDLYPPGQGPALKVGPGMRAVTIPLSTSTSLADGQIQPHQYVDIHFTPASSPDAERTGGMTMTLFKGVQVLAINGDSAPTTPSRGGNSVTLEVTPGQANILLLAKDKGTLDLVYTPDGKGDGIVAVEDQHRATLYEILGLEDPQPPPADPPFVTEVYSGSGRRMQEFKDGLRADRFAIERLDYNRRYDDRWGGRYRPGYWGGNAPVPYWEYNYGGYYSVPNATPHAPAGAATNGGNSQTTIPVEPMQGPLGIPTGVGGAPGYGPIQSILPGGGSAVQ